MVQPPPLKPPASTPSSSAAPEQPFFAPPTPMEGSAFGLTVAPKGSVRLGQPVSLNVWIRNPETGRIPNKFEIVHEKPAHIIIVSQDLTDFQHVHPDVVRPGFLQIPATFKKPGAYKMFMQFTTKEDGEQTLSQPINVGVNFAPNKPLIPDANRPKMVDGYTYKISDLPTRDKPVSMPRVEVTKNGEPVKTLEPYLGAGAHGVIIGDNATSFLHVHPMSNPKNGLYQSPVMFHTEIKQPGLYKMWVQTQIDGKLKTVDWTFQV